MRKIEFSGKTYILIFNENANCWTSIIKVEGLDIDFEIDMSYYNQNEVDWKLFEKFLTYISAKNRLLEFVKYGNKPIHEIGNAFFIRAIDEIEAWKMHFSNSIIFRGQSKGINHKENFEFSLVYDFFVKNENESVDGDPYGLYLVDITSNEGINGARRIE